jgi:hypothetical protein
MNFDDWYRVFWRGPAPGELESLHKADARTAWEGARASVTVQEKYSSRTDISLEEYWQRQREKFWRQAYMIAYEVALTSPAPLPPQISKDTPNYAHNVAFLAAEEALLDLDLSRKRGRLSYRYYF